MQKFRLTRLNLLVHVATWVPLIVLIWDFYARNLTVNPIQDVEQRTGKIALILLVLSLACTPLNTLTGWRQILLLRRPLGLYAFAYASIHFIVFIGLDYGFDLSLLSEAIFEKPYALVGFLALLLLLPLAFTSYRYWMTRLGKNWKRLHRLAYIAAGLVILHYAWVVKGTLSAFQGNILQPLLFGVLLIFLLGLRLPPIRKRVVAWRALRFPRSEGRRKIGPEQRVVRPSSDD